MAIDSEDLICLVVQAQLLFPLDPQEAANKMPQLMVVPSQLVRALSKAPGAVQNKKAQQERFPLTAVNGQPSQPATGSVHRWQDPNKEVCSRFKKFNFMREGGL